MGLIQTEHFSEPQNEFAQWAKVLAHPARIAILEHIIQVGECVCGEVVDALPLAQPTVSQHLKALRECGLLKAKINGTSVCYCINLEVWQSVQNRFAAFFQQYTASN